MAGGKQEGRGDSYSFLPESGATSALIAAFDWSTTSLGPIESWPQSLKSTLSVALRSPVPIAILWGPDGVMLYNDGYAEVAGGRHPTLLGSKVLDGWPEIADFNRHVIETGLAGGNLAYRDQELTIKRHGAPEQAWFNLDYSPIPDDDGNPAGVIAIVVETTRRIRAEKQLEKGFETLRSMFEQAPGFMAILTGEKHSFAMVNAAYMQLIGHRDALGKPVAEVLPEIVEQGFIELLDRVYTTGERYVGRGIRVALQRQPGAAPEERFLDFLFQPVIGDEGETRGIFVQGHDVTEQKLGENALRESEERFRLLAESAPVKLWMGDTGGRCVYLNAALRRFWGVTPDEVPDFDWMETVHPEDRETLNQSFAKAMKKNEPFS
ncbi:PAS domain S-box protein, partial [Parvibaculum sp.]|uniref:PAS domain S-box protein n=1 Tax=Parvibaculum sp. TaxID=2024848 RepID=UPI003BAD73D0